jgi:hypothetical protein
MVQTGCFEKFHEMVFQLSRLVLEVLLSDCDILLVKDVSFLVLVIAGSSNYDPPGALLLPLFAALGAFPSAFVKGFGRCRPAVVGDHFPIT